MGFDKQVGLIRNFDALESILKTLLVEIENDQPKDVIIAHGRLTQGAIKILMGWLGFVEDKKKIDDLNDKLRSTYSLLNNPIENRNKLQSFLDNLETLKLEFKKAL